MAINLSEAGFGYLLIAVGVIVAAGMLWGLSSKANLGGYRIKLQHLAFPFIAIAVGISFLLGRA